MTRQELLESNEFWDEKLTSYKRDALSKKLIIKDIVKHVREAFAIMAVSCQREQLVCELCDGTGGRVIYDTYLKCKNCYGSGAN